MRIIIRVRQNIPRNFYCFHKRTHTYILLYIFNLQINLKIYNLSLVIILHFNKQNKVSNLRGKEYCRRNLWFERRDE